MEPKKSSSVFWLTEQLHKVGWDADIAAQAARIWLLTGDNRQQRLRKELGWMDDQEHNMTSELIEHIVAIFEGKLPVRDAADAASRRLEQVEPEATAEPGDAKGVASGASGEPGTEIGDDGERAEDRTQGSGVKLHNSQDDLWDLLQGLQTWGKVHLLAEHRRRFERGVRFALHMIGYELPKAKREHEAIIRELLDELRQSQEELQELRTAAGSDPGDGSRPDRKNDYEDEYKDELEDDVKWI